jgi:hypothetical protein
MTRSGGGLEEAGAHQVDVVGPPRGQQRVFGCDHDGQDVGRQVHDVPAVAGPPQDVRGQLIYLRCPRILVCGTCRAAHDQDVDVAGCCGLSACEGAEEAGVRWFGRPVRQRIRDPVDDRRAHSGQCDDCVSRYVVSVEQVERGVGVLFGQDDALSRESGQDPTDTVWATRAGHSVNLCAARPGRGGREGMQNSSVQGRRDHRQWHR